MARNFSAVPDGIEREQEEVVLVRNRRQIARLAKSGRTRDFRVQDLWLAARAIERKFTLLAGNARDFRHVPGA